MQTWQTTLFLLRALCSGQQCGTLLKAPSKNFTCKRLTSCEPRLGSSSALTYSPIVSCRHVVPVILLHWVSNGSKHKHMALYHVVTRARRPFARIIIANGFLSQEAKYNGAEKMSSADYHVALSNAQRNATNQMPHSTVAKSFPHSSLFVI